MSRVEVRAKTYETTASDGEYQVIVTFPSIDEAWNMAAAISTILTTGLSIPELVAADERMRRK
jgi:hypothetical protein